MDDKYVLQDPGNLKAAVSQMVGGEIIFVRLDQEKVQSVATVSPGRKGIFWNSQLLLQQKAEVVAWRSFAQIHLVY